MVSRSAAAVLPEWRGPLPHTVLIAPGSKIICRQIGVIDPVGLLVKIIEELGLHYTPQVRRNFAAVAFAHRHAFTLHFYSRLPVRHPRPTFFAPQPA